MTFDYFLATSLIPSNNLKGSEKIFFEDCIIMDQVVLKKGCSLRKTIVDKLNMIEEGEQFGFDPDKDRFRCHIDTSGIAVIPKNGRPIKALKKPQL